MREDLTFEDFARDYYGESRHEYSDTVEIEQEKKLFGYKDRYPGREEKIQRLCYKPITFCRTYNVPFQEEIRSEFKIRKLKYQNYRDETITKTVSFTIEGRKAEEILAKMCQDSQNGLLTEYKKDSNGKTIYDEFNIDPHTLSAIWYGLDTVTVADVKFKSYNSKSGDDVLNVI